MAFLGPLVWDIVSNTVVQYAVPWLSDFVSQRIHPLWQRYWPVVYQSILVPMYHLASDTIPPLLDDILSSLGDSSAVSSSESPPALGETSMDNFSALPEVCISLILSMTSPRDVCRSAAISSGFSTAANSDSLWEKFLPSDYRQIVTRSLYPVAFSTKKQLYFSLCHSPLLLDGGRLSFAVDKESGKKCFTIPARELAISWKEDSRYWKWIWLPESRFPEVVQLLNVCWLDIGGRINTVMLSANTTYATYLIFKIADHKGLDSVPVKCSVGFVNDLEDGYQDDMRCVVYLTLEPREQNGRLPQMRKDGWMEVELGEFYNEGDNGEVDMRLREVSDNNWKSGLIVEGIEVRPKDI